MDNNLKDMPGKTFIIFGEQLKEVQKMMALMQEMNERIQVIDDRARSEIERVRNAIGKQVSNMQLAVAAQFGLSDLSCWVFDTQYMKDHSMVFLKLDEELYKAKSILEKTLRDPTQH